MLVPKYFYSDTYSEYYSQLMRYPHTELSYAKGETLMAYGNPLRQYFYIKEGIAVATLNHESGHEKILSFHGKGAVYPGCHDLQFQIENSIGLRAITEVEVSCFQKEELLSAQKDNPDFFRAMYNWYASYINLLLYDSAHQSYNSSFVKLCNLLYLIVHDRSRENENKVMLTQEELSQTLAIERANVSRYLSRLKAEGVLRLHRGWLEIIDPKKLELFCTQETLDNHFG